MAGFLTSVLSKDSNYPMRHHAKPPFCSPICSPVLALIPHLWRILASLRGNSTPPCTGVFVAGGGVLEIWRYIRRYIQRHQTESHWHRCTVYVGGTSGIEPTTRGLHIRKSHLAAQSWSGSRQAGHIGNQRELTAQNDRRAVFCKNPTTTINCLDSPRHAPKTGLRAGILSQRVVNVWQDW